MKRLYRVRSAWRYMLEHHPEMPHGVRFCFWYASSPHPDPYTALRSFHATITTD